MRKILSIKYVLIALFLSSVICPAFHAVKVQAASGFSCIDEEFSLKLQFFEDWQSQRNEDEKTFYDVFLSNYSDGCVYEYKQDRNAILKKPRFEIKGKMDERMGNNAKNMPGIDEPVMFFEPGAENERGARRFGVEKPSREGPGRVKRFSSTATGAVDSRSESGLSGIYALEDDSPYVKSMILRMAFQYQFNIARGYIFEYFKGPVESAQKYFEKNYKNKIDYSRNVMSKYSSGPSNYIEKLISRHFFKKKNKDIKLNFFIMPSIMQMRINY